MTATSPSANERSDFALFCNPESRRVEGFTIALGRRLRQRPLLVPWEGILAFINSEKLEKIPPILRLESPGRNWHVEIQLLLHGRVMEDEEAARGWSSITGKQISELSSIEPGRLFPMRQWFLGWRDILQQLQRWASERAPASRWMCPPEDVICMFDKYDCHRKLRAAGIPVPPAFGIPSNFEDLWNRMRWSGCRRIFLKPCHGSSASGIVALETYRTEVQAFSTLELRKSHEGDRLYNRRKIQVHRGLGPVHRLVEAACRERCLAQAWIPKAGMFGSPFDLRVVVIGGRARHVMMRLGRGPMTNSQLLGGKGDVEALRAKMGDEAWTRMLAMCESAMTRCFPRSLYAGLDVLIEPNFRTAWILEVNAFGDLLPRILHEGLDTYEAEIAACAPA